MTNQNCYFYSNIGDFFKTSDSEILGSLKAGAEKLYNEPAGDSQIRAWKDEISVLKNAAQELPNNWIVIFEYILPREEGRRPDVIILTGTKVLVLEFKQYTEEHHSQIDQVVGYTRDLREYHSYCFDKAVVPFLVLTKTQNKKNTYDDVQILSPDTLVASLLKYKEDTCEIDAIGFLEGEYQPLPTILSAAIKFFNNEPLPQIRTVKSLKINETLAFMQAKADDAIKNHKNLLMFVTGVPGAGKTLVGLQFTFNNSSENKQDAVMLSGNGPLVEVLQYVLKSKNFVSSVNGFLTSYGGNQSAVPKESIIIYDEAQRAWDDETAKAKRGTCSEPRDFMNVAKKKNGVVLIGLIGEGQEINTGEEAGIGQWNTAVQASDLDWEICCPSHISAFFEKPTIADELNLSSSLRSKSALQLPKWINAVLDGDADSAKQIIKDNNLLKEFPIYLIRDISDANEYFAQRYENEPEKKYGLIASAKAKNLEKYGIDNSYFATRKVSTGQWYADKKSSLFSCCSLRSCITEFAAQGLELDFPIMCWGDDFIRENGKWELKVGSKTQKDLYKIRKNSYRVLLSRGREGMFIFVPDEPKMNETYEFLKKCLGKN